MRERIWNTLGLQIEPADEAAMKKLKSTFRGGLTVTEVRPDSPADERGLRKGDILVGLDRWEMRSLENVAYALENDALQDAGETSFHILRDGQVLVGRIRLARAKAAQTSSAAEPASPDAAGSRATSIRLAEIDLREAQLKLEAASKDHARLAELAKQAGVPQSELDRAAIERQHAELAVERAQIVLDGLKSQSPPRK